MKQTLSILTFFIPALLFAQAGMLDNSFGTSGVVITDISSVFDVAYASVVQPDGKILIAGEGGNNRSFAIIRYNSNGSPDNSFGANGIVNPVFSSCANCWSSINSLAIQPDGKILAGGTYHDSLGNKFIVARFHPNGSIDTTFGNYGKGMVDINKSGYDPTEDHAYSMALQSDGKIIQGGTTFTTDWTFAVMRYHANGTIDSTFGNGGIQTDFYSGNDVLIDLALQTDGKIVAVGQSDVIGGGFHFSAVRYNTNGSFDNTFGTNGGVTVVMDSNTLSTAEAVAIQADGKIVITGTVEDNNSSRYFGLTRLNTDGKVDSTFGVFGRTLLPGAIFTTFNFRSAIVLQPDGKIIVPGVSNSSGGCTVIRFTGAGIVDSSFGTNGIATPYQGPSATLLYTAALQPDGKILGVGYRYTTSTFGDFLIIRYLNDLPLGAANLETENWQPLIYPNPIRNELNVSINNNEQTTVLLYDFLGHQVLQQTFSNSTTINTEQLADGIYFYELRNSKGTLKTGKLVKQ
jgi:uncharacterized delta-60 repeat protein